MSSSLIESLLAAVEARPEDVPLRLHLAELLIAAGRGPEAVSQLATVLKQEPGHAEVRAAMLRALSPSTGSGTAAPQLAVF
ncbi:MAG TPA: AAA family ATPase, partial [Micromonosporaceae bacterium]|nr:AAA family ATPase [Micromonosporaceae bacterium]